VSARDDHAAGDRGPDVARAEAEFRAAQNASGIGAAVVRSFFENDRRIWDCVVSDGTEWHDVRVLSTDPDPFRAHAPEDIEEGIERYAESLGDQNRLRALLNANPLHLGSDGAVTD
jgi:hypothetical protein